MLKKICTQCSKEFLTYTFKTKNPFCSCKCYGHWQKGKTRAEQGKKYKKGIRYCSIADCGRKHFGKSYCKKHYHLIITLKGIAKPAKQKILHLYICANCNKEFYSRKTHIGDRKYCSMICFAQKRRAPFIVKKGYKFILLPKHPRANGKGYVREHILIMEEHLGRSLLPGEVIHHVDGDKLNNCIDNLILFESHAAHMAHHRDFNLSSHNAHSRV